MSPGAGVVVAALVLATALSVGGATLMAARAATARRLAPRAWGQGTRTPTGSVLIPPPLWVSGRMAAAAVPLEPAAAWSAWLAVAGAAGVVAAWVGGPGLAAVVTVAVTAVPTGILVALGGRSDRLLEAALPGALETVAGALRSGASLRQAIEEAAAVTPHPLGGELATVATEVANGIPLVGALEAWGARRPLAGVRLAVASLGLGAETGGAHARAVDGVAATLRARLGMAEEVRALSAQARLSASVIALAPLGFGAVAASTDERTATFLFRTPLGLACLAAGLALDGVAAVWMHRLTRVEG